MRRAIVAQRVDWQAEREAFLSDAKSTHTAEAYRRALQHLGTWLVFNRPGLPTKIARRHLPQERL
jgi:hypothetical protein